MLKYPGASAGVTGARKGPANLCDFTASRTGRRRPAKASTDSLNRRISSRCRTFSLKPTAEVGGEERGADVDAW